MQHQLRKRALVVSSKHIGADQSSLRASSGSMIGMPPRIG
jgi:hypothetical protein